MLGINGFWTKTLKPVVGLKWMAGSKLGSWRVRTNDSLARACSWIFCRFDFSTGDIYVVSIFPQGTGSRSYVITR